MGAPILDQSTAEGRDIMALIQMMTSELHAGKPSMRGVAGQKHARLSDHREAAHWRLAEVAPALTYIANHYAEPCSIETLAQLCSMSTSTLRRKFYSVLGCAPFDYVHRVRIGTATAMLLAENMPVQDVCS